MQPIQNQRKEPLSCEQVTEQIDKLFGLLLHNHTIINQHINSDSISTICDVFLPALSLQQFSLQTRQKAASILKILYQRQMHSFRVIARSFFEIITNFKIQSRIKGIFSDSIFSVLTKYSLELEDLFERAVVILLQMIEAVGMDFTSQRQTLNSPPLVLSALPFPLSFSFQWPTDASSIFSTIIMMGTIFNGNQSHKNPKYKGDLVLMFRKVNDFVLREQWLARQPQLVDQLLQFWSIVVKKDYDDEEEKRAAKKKDTVHQKISQSYRVIDQITSWNEFYQQLQTIFNFRSPSHILSKGQLQLVLHNYFVLQQNWEQRSLLATKSKAAQVLSCLLMFASSTQKLLSNPFFKQLMVSIEWSIYWSMKQLVGGSVSNFKNIEIGLHFLELFGIIFEIASDIFSEIELYDILANVIIPIVSCFLSELRELFKEDANECRMDIQDACEDQMRDTVLSKLGQSLEALCDNSPHAFHFLMQYIRYSLEETQNAAFQVWRPSDIILSLKAVNTETSLLLLAILSYKKRIYDAQYGLAHILVPAFIRQLNDFERALLYNFLSYIIIDIECEANIKEQILIQCLEPMSYQLRHFALHFLVNTDVKCLTPAFAVSFMNCFNNLGANDMKWMIFSKIVANFIWEFDEKAFLGLINSIKTEIEVEIQFLLEKVNTNSSFNTGQLINCLGLFQSIAQHQEYCVRHPLVHATLWSIVSQLENASKLSLDDLILKLAVELLEPLTIMPPNFIEELRMAKEIFLYCEYEGTSYYVFADMALRRCGPQDGQIVYEVGQMMLQVISYVLYYPEQRIQGTLVNMSNAMLVLQNLFFNHPREARSEMQVETLNICNQALEEFRKKYPAIVGRIINLKLILERSCGSQLSLQMVALHANQRRFANYDALTLLYLLEQYMDSIHPNDKQLILIIVVYLLRSEKEKGKKQDNKNQIKRLNAIFNYLPLFINVEINVKAQIIKLLQSFKRKEPAQYSQAFSSLGQPDIEALSEVCEEPVRKILKVTGPKKHQIQIQEPLLEPKIRPLLDCSVEEEDCWQRGRKKLGQGEPSKKQLLQLKREKKERGEHFNTFDE